MKLTINLQRHYYHIISDMLDYLEVDGEVIKDRNDAHGTSYVENLPTINGFTFIKQLIKSRETNNYAWWLQFKNGLKVVD